MPPSPPVLLDYPRTKISVCIRHIHLYRHIRHLTLPSHLSISSRSCSHLQNLWNRVFCCKCSTPSPSTALVDARRSGDEGMKEKMYYMYTYTTLHEYHTTSTSTLHYTLDCVVHTYVHVYVQCTCISLIIG